MEAGLIPAASQGSLSTNPKTMALCSGPWKFHGTVSAAADGPLDWYLASLLLSLPPHEDRQGEQWREDELAHTGAFPGGAARNTGLSKEMLKSEGTSEWQGA